jgi:hypothetical protein
LTQFRDELVRGAVFIDPDGWREGLIWLIEGKIGDGLDQVVGRKMFTLYHPTVGEPIEELPPGIFLDFEAPPQPISAPGHVASLLDKRGDVISWSITNLIEPYRRELAEKRAREVGIVERYLRESFDVLIARSDGLLMDYEAKQAQGRDMRVKILEEERRNDNLRRRRQERLSRTERERQVMLTEPRILGVAAIVPQADTTGAARPSRPSMRRDDEVEQAAIAYVMAYETRHNRASEDRSGSKLPYDIYSKGPEGEIRYIEVKGRAGEGGVELSEREWLTAENYGPNYWLYIVTNAMTRPQLHQIQDPTSRLQSENIVKRTRYFVPPESWQQVAFQE